MKVARSRATFCIFQGNSERSFFKALLPHVLKTETEVAMTNQIVTALCEEQGLDKRLFYFGKYFKKSKQNEQPAPILSDSELTRKQELLECYASQSKVVDGLSHILAYEQLQAAK